MCENLRCFLSLLVFSSLLFFAFAFAFALLVFITLSLFRQGERAGTTSKRSTWHAWLEQAKSTTNQQQQKQHRLLQLQHTEWPQNMRQADRAEHVEQRPGRVYSQKKTEKINGNNPKATTATATVNQLLALLTSVAMRICNLNFYTVPARLGFGFFLSIRQTERTQDRKRKLLLLARWQKHDTCTSSCQPTFNLISQQQQQWGRYRTQSSYITGLCNCLSFCCVYERGRKR